MAELLASAGWAAAGTVSAYLEETLPEDYIVVPEPALCRGAVAAVVVGHCSLLTVRALDEKTPEKTPAAAAIAPPQESLRQFLKDEFPSWTLPIRELTAARGWTPDGASWCVVGSAEMRDQLLADAIVTLDIPEAQPATGRNASRSATPSGAWADESEQRAALAVALRDRQLSATQRASRPFVFRSGSRLRTGTRVWTIRDAVRHMDRYPADGTHHLRDGTLAAWLDEEGAPHLARLAREAINQPRVDLRVALETFLISTGLVARPAIVFRPRALDLGYVVQGNKASRLLRVRKGRGRGHLFGDVTTDEPWLNVEPDTFQGRAAEMVVSADTTGLPIDNVSHPAELRVASSAGEEPLAVPVSVRVVALPGGANRALLRPLAGIGVTALLGALIGFLWHLAGVAVTPWLAAVALPGGLWPWLLGAVWAVAGLLRVVRQPPAWPIRYALGRWLGRAAAWSAGLAALAVAIVWAWDQGFAGGLTLPNLTLAAVAAVAAGFGFVPAALDEMANGRHAMTPGFVHGRHSRRRAAILAGAAVVLLLVLLLTPRLAAPTVQRWATGETADTARSWIVERVEALDQTLDAAVDRLIRWYYKK